MKITNKDKVLKRFPSAVCEINDVFSGFRDYSVSTVVTRTNDGAFAKGDFGRHIMLGYGNTESDAWTDAYNRFFPLNLVTGLRKLII